MSFATWFNSEARTGFIKFQAIASLKSNREYWIEKIEENMARDLRDDQMLMQAGWVPIHFWEKEVIKDLSMCVATIEEIILAQLIDSADAQETIDYEE